MVHLQSRLKHGASRSFVCSRLKDQLTKKRFFNLNGFPYFDPERL
jgi:hypothetical protein